MPDENTRLAALRTRKLDDLGVKWMQAQDLWESDPEFQWLVRESISCGAYPNNSKAPYSDIRARMAMQTAINIPALAEDCCDGYADPYPFQAAKSQGCLWTPFEELPADRQEAFVHNPEGVNALLAEAGYPDGFKQIWTLSSTIDAEYRELTDLFIAYFEAIGIETEMEVIESASYTSYLGAREQDVYRTYSCGYWLPHQVMEHRYGGWNTYYNRGMADDPLYKQIKDDVGLEPDPDMNAEMHREASIRGTGQLLSALGRVRQGYRFWRPWIKGYHGAEWLGSLPNMGPIMARAWVDQNLKHEITGVRDQDGLGPNQVTQPWRGVVNTTPRQHVPGGTDTLSCPSDQEPGGFLALPAKVLSRDSVSSVRPGDSSYSSFRAER